MTIEELKAVVAKMTSGPWSETVEDRFSSIISADVASPFPVCAVDHLHDSRDNATGIVSLRNHIDWLIELVEEAEAFVERGTVARYKDRQSWLDKLRKGPG